MRRAKDGGGTGIGTLNIKQGDIIIHGNADEAVIHQIKGYVDMQSEQTYARVQDMITRGRMGYGRRAGGHR